MKVKLIRTLSNDSIQELEKEFATKHELDKFIKENPWWIIIS